MAAQELRWLTCLLTDLGEQPRSPPVLYVDNKAMIALCQEHRLEHRTKHIALPYFLAQEFQQCGQLRLAYVATRANTADIFSKALPPGVGAVGAGAVATGGAAGAGAAGGTGAGGAAGVVAGDPGAEGTGAVSAVSGGASRPRPYYVPLLQQVLGLPPSTSPTPPLLSPLPVQSQSQLQPASPLPGPSPYSGPTRGLTELREPESCPASSESRPASPESRPESRVHAVCTGRCVPRQRPPPDPGTHSMTLCPSIAPQRVPLPSPPASALPDGPDCQTYICYGLFRL
ncbi:unnamed protein product [Closterium sp. NIES-54]